MFTWLKNAKEQNLTLAEQRKARFTMSHEGEKFVCEECGGDKFRKTTDIIAKCIECGVAYSVAYNRVVLEVIYYEG